MDDRRSPEPFDLGWEQDRIRALLNRDLDRLAACLADSFIFIHSTGRIDSKESYLKLLGGDLAYTRIEASDVRVTTATRDLALVFANLAFSAIYGGKDITVEAYCLTTWARGSQGWKIVAIQATTRHPTGR